MKRNELDQFEKLCGQLQAVYDELSTLSKKTPNDAVNKFKLKFINQLLSEANEFLGKRYAPFDNFSTFNDDEIPQNSDVVFILNQYLQCFEKFRADHVIRGYQHWHWQIEPEEGEKPNKDGTIHVETITPKRLRE